MENNDNKKLYEKANDKLEELYYKAESKARDIGYDRIENGVKTAKLVIFFAAVLSVLLFIQVVLTFSQTRIVLKYSRTSQGKVIAHEKSKSSDDTQYYNAVISFEHNGSSYRGTTTGTLTKQKDLPAVNETVTVRFDPSDHSKVYITKGSARDAARLALLIAGLLLNILCILLLTGRSISVFRPESKNKLVAFTAKRSTLSLGIFIAATVALIAFTTIL